MNRRKFLSGFAAAAATPIFINGLPLTSMADSPLLSMLARSGNCDGRVLVLIQLNGGNDGLNTVIPLDQYDKLFSARQSVVIPEDKVLPVTGNSTLGLHPSMTGLRDMYNNGLVTMVQNVGYPNQDFSHFRSTDIWLTGSASNTTLNTGWLGRYLDTDYPDFPTGYPNAITPDPLAIQVGYVVSPAFQGPNGTFGMAITDPENFYQLITDTESTPTDTPRGHELAFLRQTARQTNAYADRVKGAAGMATNLSTLYPAGNKLADQLKIVARLIAGGLQSKMYMVNLGGFDTHAQQTETDTTTGAHADLLKTLSDAIFAFQDDLKLLQVDDKVLGMTFSEFGRRIRPNGSQGTDHGAAAPLFIFGKTFSGKVIGTNPLIPTNPTTNDNVPMQYDFRSVYATIMRDWFCVPDDVVDGVFGGDFEYLPLATGIDEVTPERSISAYPNPCENGTHLHFISSGEEVKLEIYNTIGQKVGQQDRKYYPAGEQTINVDLGSLRSGNYIIRLSSRSFASTVPVTKVGL
jgi:uncharacterized protein (DUF1501 family)